VTQPYDPNLFRRLTDAEKAELAPEFGYRVTVLYRLVRAGMVRQPETEQERALANELADIYPDHYRIDP
jgi:hypothetical protein